MKYSDVYKITTAERRATLEIHPHEAACLIAGLLRLLDALQRFGQVALGNVTLEFNQHIALDGLRQLVDDRLIQPTAGLPPQGDLQVATARHHISLVGEHHTFEFKLHHPLLRIDG